MNDIRSSNLNGEQMLRYKGILNVKGEPRRVVFIGRKLPEALFRELFEDCYASDETPDDVKAYAQGSVI